MCRNFTLCKDPYLNKKNQGKQINMLGLDEKFSNDRSWGLKILTLHVQRDDWQPLRFLQQTVASNFHRNSRGFNFECYILTLLFIIPYYILYQIVFIIRGVQFECYFLDDVGTYFSTLLYNKFKKLCNPDPNRRNPPVR